jgi:hypothetical protein
LASGTTLGGATSTIRGGRSDFRTTSTARSTGGALLVISAGSGFTGCVVGCVIQSGTAAFTATTGGVGISTLLRKRTGFLIFIGSMMSGRRIVWTLLVASGGSEMISCGPAYGASVRPGCDAAALAFASGPGEALGLGEDPAFAPWSPNAGSGFRSGYGMDTRSAGSIDRTYSGTAFTGANSGKEKPALRLQLPHLGKGRRREDAVNARLRNLFFPCRSSRES